MMQWILTALKHGLVAIGVGFGNRHVSGRTRSGRICGLIEVLEEATAMNMVNAEDF
jgi:hypothetical protein